MYSGTNIILSTNNDTMVTLLGNELIQLRNIDSILIRNYQNTIESIISENPQALIVNCQNSIEEPACLDLIQKIKKTTSSPILLVVEQYNPQFIRQANKAGISDVLPIHCCATEILMRTIWGLQKNELKQQHKKYEKLLTQLNAIDPKTEFYTSKYSSKVFENEIEYLKSKQIDSIVMAIEPNKNSRLHPSKENIISTIKSNVRSTDTVAHTKIADRFYILLANTNLEGALVVWNRLNNSIGAQETLCGCICPPENADFEKIEAVMKDGLSKAQDAPNCLYLIESISKVNKDWLENDQLQDLNSHKDFKLFRQMFSKKLENTIKPTIENLIKEYEELLSKTETPFVETENSFSVKFVNKRQESEFTITQEGRFVTIDSVHNGFDSPENKKYTLDLNEISKREVENDFEEFILEYKTCL